LETVGYEPTILGTFNAYHGWQSQLGELLKDTGVDTDLTNPIIDGGNVNVELGVDDPNPPKYWSVRGGEYVLCNFGTESWMAANFRDGAEIVGTLTVPDAWIIKIHHGQRIDFELSTTVQMAANFRDGAEINKFDFYSPPYLAGAGEYMEATLKIDYEIEFNETGCLDNEHQYYEEDGSSVDKLKTTTATVEMKPFKHSIKARCY
jgi:hypothetical protein